VSLEDVTDATTIANGSVAPLFTNTAEQTAAQVGYRAIERLQRNPNLVPHITYWDRPEVQERLVREVEATYATGQIGMDGIAPTLNIPGVVRKLTEEVIDKTISIPRITVVPVGELQSGFRPFELDLSGFTPIRESAVKGEGEMANFRQAPANRSEIRKIVYGGFQRCLQTAQKFDSNPERLLAVILERETQKWFRPAGQFQITGWGSKFRTISRILSRNSMTGS
jgi:hypothetical protein